MRALIYSLIVCTALPISCKRGEEDPGISFRSRNQRLIGSWVMTSKERTTESVRNRADDSEESEYVHNSTYSYDGTTATTVDDFTDITTYFGPPVTVSDNSRHTEKTEEGSYTLDVNKDGTYAYKNDFNLIAELIDYVNATVFDIDTTYTNNNQVVELTDYWWWDNAKKKKVLITLAGSGTYKLIRLSNKEMIWEYVYGYESVGAPEPWASEYVTNITERITWAKQ